MSVVGRSVTDMSKHICVYFDDGDLGPVCVCGEQVVVVLDEHGVEVVAALAVTAASRA